MTAESTVPSPAGQPRDLRTAAAAGATATAATGQQRPPGASPVSVLPPRTGGPRARPPAGRPPARPAPSALPLLVADGTAATTGALALTGAPYRPELAVLLVAAALLLRPPVPARRLPALLDELPAVLGRIAVVWLALAALTAAYDPQHALSARTLLLGLALHAAASCAARGTVHGWRRTALAQRPCAALVVGPAATAQRVAAAVLRDPRCGVRPVGVVADDPDGAEGLPVLTTGEEVQRAIVQNGVRDVLVVRPPARAGRAPLPRALAESGCTVWEIDAEPAPTGPYGDRLAGFPCRRPAPLGRGPAGTAGKRVLDVLASGVLLLLTGPLLLACATVLRISSGPGVVFKQERIGAGGRPFTLLKFRTHRPADAHESATRWSVADEQRMPWFCRFLRRTSLDELLQLWNVFRGDMSLVGPRPERPYFVDRFSQAHPGYAARHRMPVGITGLAQIHGLRGDTSIEDRARLDNAYIDDWSLWQDVCILLRTAVSLVRPTGS
ncbi:exopolysaccharide biosynthesis polyprenyl glycosylphosphotransferase [Streptomyces poriticola]|uniref:exopolysaccharide biosynthesis polyprenyl glycosylphosphotransferase n=1 Tax=Streptomyces poriticola TaxID=3120506 RepID=UPI002FCE619E